MDASSLSPEAVLALAKQHLGFAPSASATTVPKPYLDELRAHIMLYPYDINFKMTLEPGRGYGVIACLEQGCNNAKVPLTPRTKTRDGGKKDGLGSMSAYRIHIEAHPTHIANRHARVKASAHLKQDSAASSGNPVKQERRSSSGLLSRFDTTTTSLATSHLPIKQERKPSGLLARIDLRSGAASLNGNQSRTSALARVPTEPDLTATPRPLSSTSRALRSSRSSLIKPEPAESTIPRKRTSGASFDTFHQTPGATAKKLKFEPPKTPLAMVNGNTGSSENVLMRPRVPTMSIEDARTKIAEIQLQISEKQSLLDRIMRKSKKSKADQTRMQRYRVQISALRDEKGEHSKSIPAASPVKRTLSQPAAKAKAESSLPDLKLPVFGQTSTRKAAPPSAAPIASGSDVRLPVKRAARHSGDSDSESDSEIDANIIDNSDLDLEMEGPPVVLQRFKGIIPDIAPLAGMEHEDENGDYHGRGKDLFVGPQAKADDIDKFLIEAGNAEAFDGNASVEKALEKLGLQAQYELLPGLEVALMPHQTIGVAWMVDKEQSSFKGGCLGDDMGLGKTVQMIALMTHNASKDPLCKTNLIIAPTALLSQWRTELELKTNNGLKCLIYHGSSKPKKKQDILKYDVVLTTYATMAFEWPDYEALHKAREKTKRKKKADDFIASDSDSDSDDLPRKGRNKRREVGLLFNVDWYRVILDEAQAIRNRRTRASRAVTELRSVYRWCLTGTPIINSLVDVYGYLRFLKIRPWYDFTEFQAQIGRLEKKNPALAVARLQAIILTFLLRRMKNTELDGKRLIELPDKTITLQKLQFSEEERDIYKMVEARTQANFNRYLRAGTVLKNYSQVLVLLLRLRQICSHPHLIQEDGVAFIAPEEIDDEEMQPELRQEVARARRLISVDYVSKLKQKFKESALRRIQAEKESADATVEDEECPICFDAFTTPVITACAHVFCRECITNVLNQPHAEDPAAPHKLKANERPCPSCRSAICAEKLFRREAFEPTDADLVEDGKEGVKDKQKKIKAKSKEEVDSDDELMSVDKAFADIKGKGKAKSPVVSRPKRSLRPRRVPVSDDVTISEDEEEEEEDYDDDMSDFIMESGDDEEEKNARRSFKNLKKTLRKGKGRVNVVLDSDDEMDDTPEEAEVIFGQRVKATVSKDEIKLMPRFLPSTKMKYMMQFIQKLTEEKPDEKILVVSQWTGCLSLVSDYLTEQGVLHVKYQGDMNRTKRDQAVRVFMAKDKARVMLMSLKCGGVGLNLTRANNVISLDLGWSQAIEAQAFDRVHRLGQMRPVVIERLVIADTVEDRVLAMQERKQNLADGSLGEGNGKKVGRLSVRELANLFGLDHRGRVLAKD